jgi:RimJ/RimL family protein N-acetyltransferase
MVDMDIEFLEVFIDGELTIALANDSPEYWTRTSFTCKGVATSAACLVARIAFEDLNLIRLSIPMQVDNLASRRVAEKLGAVFEGVLRSQHLTPSGPVDRAMYGLLSDELRLV